MRGRKWLRKYFLDEAGPHECHVVSRVLLEVGNLHATLPNGLVTLQCEECRVKFMAHGGRLRLIPHERWRQTPFGDNPEDSSNFPIKWPEATA